MNSRETTVSLLRDDLQGGKGRGSMGAGRGKGGQGAATSQKKIKNLGGEVHQRNRPVQ